MYRGNWRLGAKDGKGVMVNEDGMEIDVVFKSNVLAKKYK